MKKYFPISVVLLAFFTLVFVKNIKGSEEENKVVGLNNSQPTNINNLSPTEVTTKPTSSPNQGKFRDGTYTGSVEDAYYGNYQVAAIISGGSLTDINFLQYPNDNRTSRAINTQAMVYLKEEAISAQSAKVDIISGASESSPAFSRSLGTALSKAQK